MKLIDLMKKLNNGYPHGQLAEYFDEKNGKFYDNKHGGDGLARFIACEVAETYTKGMRDEEQVGEAVRVLERAQQDIQDCIDALQD